MGSQFLSYKLQTCSEMWLFFIIEMEIGYFSITKENVN